MRAHSTPPKPPPTMTIRVLITELRREGSPRTDFIVPSGQVSRRIFQPGQQRGYLAPMFDDHRMRNIEPAANFARTQSIGQAFEHRFFRRQELAREQCNQLAGADGA